MYSKNSKSSHPHKLLLKFTHNKMDLKRAENSIALSDLSI